MKFDIENKILIPFMILAILPITILGLFSYWNGYQLMLSNTMKNMETTLRIATSYIDISQEKSDVSDAAAQDAKKEALRYFSSVSDDIIVIEGGKAILNNSSFDRLQPELFNNEISGKIQREDIIYLYSYDPEWNWTVAIAADRQLLISELLDIQKYILLMAIIFLVISMQSIIFIAHNISKPIKHFADVCKKIEINNLRKVALNRSDEIGVLANSFNTMIDQLNASTENLIEMKKYNEDILENIFIGIMTTNTDGEEISLNNSGKRIMDLYGNDSILPNLREQILLTLNEEQNISRIVSIPVENGAGNIYLDVSTSLLKKDSAHISGAICSFSDITERKNLENNFVRVNRLAYVGQFAAGLAHEIRNPLTGIKTSIQVIKMRLGDRKDSSSLDLADGIIYEIDRINKLITELLDFSRVKVTNPISVDAAPLIKKSLDLCSDEIAKKHISVSLHQSELGGSVLVDPGHAEQIFLNIITNAVQSMGNNGTLDISIDTNPAGSDTYTRIIFDDDGPGIDSDIRERIFDPFFTTRAKGTGLGLSVVARLLEENGGFIELDSVKGEGSRFKVYLQSAAVKEKSNENQDPDHR